MSERRPPDSSTLWREARLETILTYVVFGLVIAGAILILGREFGRHLDRFQAWIDGLGAWAPVVFVGIFVILNSLFVPDILLGILAGASFGLVTGVASAGVGSVLAAILQYTLSRFLFRPSIERWVSARPYLVRVQAAVRRQELRLQFLLRLTPLNRALTSYLLGAAGVRFRGFLLGCVALVPALALEVYVGYVGRHVAQIAERPRRTVLSHEALVLAGLIAAVVAMVVISRMARRALEAAAGDESGEA
jgi:uncharacterized membrane protein YdjX (TVP38/TMEM64 family)